MNQYEKRRREIRSKRYFDEALKSHTPTIHYIIIALVIFVAVVMSLAIVSIYK